MSPQEHPHEIALRHTGPSAHLLLTDGSPSTARLQEGPPRAEHAAPTPLYREIDSTTMTHAKNDVAAERPRRLREREREGAILRTWKKRGISVRHPLRPSFHRLLSFSQPRTKISCENRKGKKVFAAPITLSQSYLSIWQLELELLCPISSCALWWDARRRRGLPHVSVQRRGSVMTTAV